MFVRLHCPQPGFLQAKHLLPGLRGRGSPTRLGPFKSQRAPRPRVRSLSLATAPGEEEVLATAHQPGGSRDGPQLERERAPCRAPARRA